MGPFVYVFTMPYCLSTYRNNLFRVYVIQYLPLDRDYQLMPKINEKQIRECIFYLEDYHKYWLIKNVTRNPKSNKFTKLILDIKMPECRNHTRAVQVFGFRLLSELEDIISTTEPIYYAIVPSHEAGKDSEGLRAIIRHIKAKYNIKNSANPLSRIKTVAKLASGGDRDINIHLKSIIVNKTHIEKGCKILLLDDVTTTQNSLKACAQLLYDAGAEIVIKYALGKTAEE